jgi:hypothetical protein
MGNIAFAAACVLGYFMWPLFKGRGYHLLCFATTNLGFAFWYWLPAIRMLNVPPEDGFAADLAQSSLNASAWIVLAYHATALLVLLVASRSASASSIPGRAFDLRLTTPSCAFLLSSIAALTVRYSSEGPDLVLNLLLGLDSARFNMTFFNRSESAIESLLALWDIANIWAALFLMAAHVLRDRLSSAGGAMASLALVVCFLGSGTRSILLMGIFVVVACRLIRERPAGAARTQRTPASASRYWYGALALVMLMTIALAISGRFNYPERDSNFLVDSLFLHNDMFSELAFALSNLGDYSPASAVDFVLTPFTFMLPGFLGFEKSIPEHLLQFNYTRSGLDLVLGEGNFFPGIVADFHLVFGATGPLFFAAFLAVFFYAANFASKLLPDPLARLAFQITFLSYMFTSIRNIHGGLALVLILGVVLIRLGIRPARYRQAEFALRNNARMP